MPGATAFGTEFLVNTTTTNDQFEPTIAALADGRFVVVWTDPSASGGDTSSYALRRMAPQGLAVASGDYATSAHVLRLSGAPPIEGLEITLKGGQVGDEGFFKTLRDGRAGGRP